MKLTTLLLAFATAVTLSSCGDKKDTSSTDTSTESSSPLQALILNQAPEGAIEIAAVKKTAKEGDTVTINGKVIGRKDPFVDGRAMVMLGDPHVITSCDLNHDDACPTPWDVCCDDPDDIKASTLTVQVLDTDGKLVKKGLKGLSGLKELSHLLVTGTVAEGSTADNMLINATGIYVQP